MIVVWCNNYLSKYKETYFIDTADLTYVDKAGIKHEATLEAIDAIMGVCYTHQGSVLVTFDGGKFVTVKPRSLHELLLSYTRHTLKTLAEGTRGRAHRLDQHHGVLAQALRNLKKSTVGQSHDLTSRDIETYFRASYNYNPFEEP